MTNPFYVAPAGDFSTGLSGLSDTIAKVGEIKRAKKEKQDALDRFTAAKTEAIAAYESNDPDKIAEVSLKYPEISKALYNVTAFKNEKTAKNFEEALFSVYSDPSEENVVRTINSRKELLTAQGVAPENAQTTNLALQKFKENPEEFRKNVEKEIAFRYPEAWKNLREMKGEAKDRYKVVGDRLVDLEAEGQPAVVIDEKQTPYTDAAKAKTDLDNGLITPEEFTAIKRNLVSTKFKNKIDLTSAALAGDPEAIAILEGIRKDAAATAGAVATASTAGKIGGLSNAIDVDVIAKSVRDGQVLLGDVKNTFGVPVQTIVMEKVLEKDPKFNFLQPEAVVKSLNSSLTQQQKQRGMMGSFVENINQQVGKVQSMSEDVVARVGVRALDLPFRELNVRFKGSGNERVFEAYMKEISAEIQKLSQGATASIAQLPEQNRLEWEKIHDPSLSLRELKKVLLGTKEMANMRIKSVDEEIDYTLKQIGQVPKRLKELRERGEQLPKVTTQEEYDAVPSGEYFIEDGVKYRKP